MITKATTKVIKGQAMKELPRPVIKTGETINIKLLKVSYEAKGAVIGYMWGGGEGGYQARKIQADSLEALKADAKKQFDKGSLDSGMGFESLKSALLDVFQTITFQLPNGQEADSTILMEDETIHLGKEFSDKELNVLTEMLAQ